MSASVIPQSHADLELAEAALHSLARTDPSVRVETQEGQLLVQGLGALHLEIIEGRLRDEFNVRFEFGKRRVSYRESLSPSDPQMLVPENWTTNAAGKSVTTSISLSLRPLEEDETGDLSWDGNIVLRDGGRPLLLSDTYHNSHDPWAHIARGISSTLSNSPHSSLPLSRLHITVNGFTCPSDTPVSILSGASAIILRNNIRARDMGSIMEPFIQLRILVGEDCLGKVVKDLTEHGGEVLSLTGSGSSMGDDDVQPYSTNGLYIPPKWLSPNTTSSAFRELQSISPRRSIHALAPLSRMLDYSIRLRALSAGHGQFEMAAAGFQVVNESRKQEILQEIGRA